MGVNVIHVRSLESCSKCSDPFPEYTFWRSELHRFVENGFFGEPEIFFPQRPVHMNLRM